MRHENGDGIAYSDAVTAIEGGDGSEGAFGVLLDLAKADHAMSMNYVANCYATGVAVDKDLPEALRWWRKGAAKGDTLCMVNIATEYRDSLKNFRRAKWWLNRAVVAGNAEANLDLAETYYGIDKIRYRVKICRLLSSVLQADDFLSEQSSNRIEELFHELGSDCRDSNRPAHLPR